MQVVLCTLLTATSEVTDVKQRELRKMEGRGEEEDVAYPERFKQKETKYVDVIRNGDDVEGRSV